MFLSSTDDGSQDDKDGGHVFISYQWDSKTTVLKIRDQLKRAGFRVWIDEDDMSMIADLLINVINCLSSNFWMTAVY